MSFLTSIFGSKQPSTSAVDSELVNLDAELAALPDRLAAAQAALRNVADLSDEQHANVESELASARRLKVRLEAQRGQLVEAREAAARVEREADLAKRRAQIAKAVKDYSTLLSTFERQASELTKTAAAMAEVEKVADRTNREIADGAAAGLKVPARIATPYEIHFSEPDEVEPDRVVTEERTIWLDRPEDRLDRAEDEEAHSARLAARLPSKRVETVERLVPGIIRRRGRHMPSPAGELVIPATRLGRARIWPPAS